MIARKTKHELSPEKLEIKLAAEADLEKFINLIHPLRVLGNIHREIISWWNRPEAKSHQLLLLPRDHMKSALVAYRIAWSLTKDPTLRVLLISSTSNLATKQLKFIKDIITSDTYRMFWPEMVNKDEAKREKWTEREISVDHPLRKKEAIRDPSVFTAGLTSNIVGMHCDIAILDDVVVASNAYIEEGREKVKEQYSLLSSIEGVNAKEWVVGTRYHPNDLYNDLQGMEVQSFNDVGEVGSSTPLFEVFGGDEERKRQVEYHGEFLWPRQKRADGKWFGFDSKILELKRSQYSLNPTHFRAQYYNDPHDIESAPIKRDLFQYYEPSFIHRNGGHWFFRQERLNVVAAVDFAYSVAKKADFTAIVVLGVDGQNNYYVLDIDRFKTDQISQYYQHIFRLYEKWGFRKIRAEVSVAQQAIVKDLKDSYIRPLGLSLSVDEYRPSRWQGAKEERILSTLEPRYANRQIWHYPGGNCQILEEELIFNNPPHDDVKDALAAAVDFSIGQAPVNTFRTQKKSEITYEFHSRFGGVV